MLTFIPSFLVLAASLSAPAGFDEGLAAYKNREYATALAELRPAAEAGDPRAQHMLGFLYAQGRGVEKDIAKTLELWRLSASQGHPPAQFTLGSLYRKGMGVKEDKKKAAELIGRAADAGYADAQYLYAIMLAQGEGIGRDLAAAYMWLDMAAAQTGLEAGAYWAAIDSFLSPAERREAERQRKRWGDKP